MLVAGLHSGRYEMALGYDLATYPDLDVEVLCEVEPHALLSADHRLAGRPRVSLAALADEPLVLLDLPHSRDYFARLFEASGVTPVVRHRTLSAELARALVSRGGCYTILNLRPRTDISIDGLPYATVALDVPLPPEESSLRLSLLRLVGGRRTRRAKAVAELCRTVVPGSIQHH